jgi:large subunit ribosomal protein L25
MKATVTLSAERRTDTGKGAARKLRAGGRIPAVIYGHGREPESLSLSQSELDKVLHQIAGGSTIIDLNVEGAAVVQALIREVQRHPTRKAVHHVDFYEVHAGERLTLDVPIALAGSPDGVRNGGGVLEQFLREITIEVLPRDIPERVEVDVTDLKIANSLHVSDLQIENAKILTDPKTTICTVVAPRVEAEPVVAFEEEEEAAEPELIRKARGEEEESEEEESEE